MGERRVVGWVDDWRGGWVEGWMGRGMVGWV